MSTTDFLVPPPEVLNVPPSIPEPEPTQITAPNPQLHAALSALFERPHTFDFFKAVRLLECSRPDLPRVGFSISPSEDPVRFWQKPSLRFPPSTIDSVEPKGTAPRMAVNFFGLFGFHGPLPPHLTEYVLSVSCTTKTSPSP